MILWKTPRWLKAVLATRHVQYPRLAQIVHLLNLRPTYHGKKRRLRKQIQPLNIPLIGYIHMPKTGGNYVDSFRTTFPHLNFGHVVLRKDRSDRFCPLGLTAMDEKNARGFYLFSTVRHPVQFLVSYYYHSGGEVEDYNNPNFHDCELAKKGFDTFINTILDREDAWPGRKFLFPQIFSQTGNCMVDWINRNEQLDDGLIALARQFGITIAPQPRKLVTAKARPPARHYSPKLLQRVMDTYSREMKVFGYQGMKEVVEPAISLQPAEKPRIHYGFLEDQVTVDDQIIHRVPSAIMG